MEKNCFTIAIAGVTGSGKSTLAHKITRAFTQNKCILIGQDNYYKDWSHLPIHKRKLINFDDIRSFDCNLLARNLICLKKGEVVLAPLYDFFRSRRQKKTNKIEPGQVIIVEGLMPFINNKIRNLFDYKIYIKADSYLCFARRLRRDTKERGDSIESVCKRYFKDVLPMQKKYVEPQRKFADLVVDGNKKFNDKLIQAIIKKIMISEKCKAESEELQFKVKS